MMQKNCGKRTIKSRACVPLRRERHRYFMMEKNRYMRRERVLYDGESQLPGDRETRSVVNLL
jgi:hypothetical protein